MWIKTKTKHFHRITQIIITCYRFGRDARQCKIGWAIDWRTTTITRVIHNQMWIFAVPSYQHSIAYLCNQNALILYQLYIKSAQVMCGSDNNMFKYWCECVVLISLDDDTVNRFIIDPCNLLSDPIYHQRMAFLKLNGTPSDFLSIACTVYTYSIRCRKNWCCHRCWNEIDCKFISIIHHFGFSRSFCCEDSLPIRLNATHSACQRINVRRLPSD